MIDSPPAQSGPPPISTKQPEPDGQKLTATPYTKSTRQNLFARVIKAIFRPILKVLYYSIKWIRSHRTVSLLAILLLIAGVVGTLFLEGGASLGGSANSGAVAQAVKSNQELSPDVQNWLLALKNGDLTTMLSIDKSINPTTRPPDTALYILEFSEPHAGVTWTNVAITGMSQGPDGLTDTFVEIVMTQPSTNGGGTTVSLWHFSTTIDGRIYLLDYVSARTSGSTSTSTSG